MLPPTTRSGTVRSGGSNDGTDGTDDGEDDGEKREVGF